MRDIHGLPAVNRVSLRQRARSYLRRPLSLLLFLLVGLAALLTAATLLFIIGYILVRGAPHITPSLVELTYNSVNVSLFPAVVTTVMMTHLSLLIAAPLGIFTAIYLVEYARRGNRLVGLVRITSETLSGIPSIVYGFFGMVVIVPSRPVSSLS